jgi:hypothetical protein
MCYNVRVTLISFVYLLHVPEHMKSIQCFVSWSLVVSFLNKISRQGVEYYLVERSILPVPGTHRRALPEDFLIRG